METLLIGKRPLTIEDVVNVARNKVRVEISEEAKARIKESSDLVEKFVEEERVIYGITTGFGRFSDVSISKAEIRDLQRNLIISHSTGVGEVLCDDEIRAILLLRINALSRGFSGIRLETLEELLWLLNEDIIPYVPSQGSLGASGDLAPLAHVISVILGEGKCKYHGEWISAKEMLEKEGKKPYDLAAKEGLALINGTQVMTAIGTLTLYDAMRLFDNITYVSGLTMEALRGIRDVFDPRLHEVRPHKGQMEVARRMRELLKDSELISSQGELRVQDAYTLRCIPQVHGASLDALNYIKEHVEIEINSVTDNPIIFKEDEIAISGGNFHGQPMALPFDFLGIAISELANISERRIERLVNPNLSGLPAFLTNHGGLHSGFMIAQYTAASLVSENKVLAHPASVDSIPSSANQEDHVSMGTIAARKAKSILKNARNVLAIELLCACQGIDMIQGKDKLSKGTKKVYEGLRERVSAVDLDRFLASDIESAAQYLKEDFHE
ncbi:histidine ammonia-lyase [Guggenheimella bovis]